MLGVSKGTLSLPRAPASHRATGSRHLRARRDATLIIAGSTDPTRPSGLCESARAILADPGTGLLACDVHALVRPDLGTLDALARLILVAGELGGEVVLLDARPELRDLLHLAGLADVVRCVSRSGVERRG